MIPLIQILERSHTQYCSCRIRFIRIYGTSGQSYVVHLNTKIWKYRWPEHLRMQFAMATHPNGLVSRLRLALTWPPRWIYSKMLLFVCKQSCISGAPTPSPRAGGPLSPCLRAFLRFVSTGFLDVIVFASSSQVNFAAEVACP